jgi:hypothetical protein
MPVGVGILCEKCETVYFISGSRRPAHITYDRIRREFRLACISPRAAVATFHKADLTPYSASAEALELGRAKMGDCHPIRRN